MKNKTLILGIMIGSLATAIPVAISSCGQVNAPLTVLGESDTIPQLGVPFANTFSLGGGSNMSSASGFTFTAAGAIPLAPANGIIISYDGTTMLIQHSNRLTTKLTNIPTPIVRVGDYVVTGQQLSQQSFLTSSFTLSVLLDGNAICPWSFFSPTARSFLTSTTFFSGAFSSTLNGFVPCTSN